MSELNRQGQSLLSLLVKQLTSVTPGKPETYIGSASPQCIGSHLPGAHLWGKSKKTRPQFTSRLD